MNRLGRISFVIIVLTAMAAGLGGWVGVHLGLHQVQAPAGLDVIVHRQIHLTADQDRQLAVLETHFAVLRKARQVEMQSANADLAEAIGAQHAYGRKAQEAVSRFHAAMGALQEDTIRHVFAMRAVMTPEQAHQFDVLVARALTSPTS
ncbi:periplasmic heavy metal sensor [Lichenicoccus roseus]|uniref:Periplasmic heavy metal sensor n=1 Tax=Lichenicoccus roseus TaxID=2683649 RepID=A0A5R9J0R0_9PROT|nr:periplasmic heavy metal sensor [Lichenicoccus roseus]TLU71112.1 periplasmic heavy metal sensor [Lichenicoccus roseus]